MDTEDKKRLWFCSDYGIEFESIIKKLNKNGEENYIVSHDKQKRWIDVNEEYKEIARKAEKSGYEIYGVGLEGILAGAIVKNLHSSTNENVSLLEQVNEIVGDRMSLDEQFISAYSLGGTERMKQVADKLKLSTRDVNDVIENILFRNRRSVGIPLETEAEALRKLQASNDKRRSNDFEMLIALDGMLQPNKGEYYRS